MQKTFFYLSYALKSLRRGGQRVVLALLCVAFGVMSLVAMQNLAGSIGQVILIDPRLRLGGDALINRAENFLRAEQLNVFEKLQREGVIESFTPIARSEDLMLRLTNSGKVTFVNEGLGIDPASYPLYGKFALSQNQSLSEAIRTTGNAVPTKEIVDQLDLKVGDTFIVTDQAGGTPTTLRVSGIIEQTPDHKGGKIYYSLATARQMRGEQMAITGVLVRWSNANPATRNQLTASGWQISNAGEGSATDQRIADVFDFMLKGAGILGLLVGGIGVANTMLVLLAGRREEIAILKTLGIRKQKLFIILGLETVLLGAGGSVVGILLALALTGGLLYLFRQAGTMLLVWSFDAWLILGGLLSGTFTALIFGMFAIVRASEVRPMALLRQLPTEKRWGQTALLAVALAIPFGGFTSLILGSLWNGLLILIIAFAGLVFIGGVLGLLIWLVLKGMPTFRFYLLKMARQNLNRRWLANVFATVALFIGVYALTFAGAVVQSSQDQLSQRSLDQSGYNLMVTANVTQEGAVRAALTAQNLAGTPVRYEVLPTAITLVDGTGGNELSGIILQGRETLWDVTPTSEPNWNANPNEVYLPEQLKLAKGTKLVITGATGVQETVNVVGTYRATDFNSRLLNNTDGIVMSKALALKLGDTQTRLTFVVQVPVEQLVQTGETVGKALPPTLVVTAAELNAYFTQQLRSLFWFAVAMAGLAILAGAMLVGNTVGLAMVERRREIGILKAVGYTRRHVLQTILLEYGLLTLLAGICAVVAVHISMLLMTSVTGGVLALEIVTALGGIGGGLIVTLVAAGLASWQPLQVRPVVILNR
jgi:putative ABC transport system permease protein